jgi:hypothetical protein
VGWRKGRDGRDGRDREAEELVGWWEKSSRKNDVVRITYGLGVTGAHSRSVCFVRFLLVDDDERSIGKKGGKKQKGKKKRKKKKEKKPVSPRSAFLMRTRNPYHPYPHIARTLTIE